MACLSSLILGVFCGLQAIDMLDNIIVSYRGVACGPPLQLVDKPLIC